LTDALVILYHENIGCVGLNDVYVSKFKWNPDVFIPPGHVDTCHTVYTFSCTRDNHVRTQPHAWK